MRSWLKQVLLSTEWGRVFLLRLRLWWFVRVRRRLKTRDAVDAFGATVAHNLAALRTWHRRMELLVRPLSVIETLDRRNAKVLVIGPRNEYDLLLLAAHGFSWSDLTGLDLISYSPRIDLGDMHALPYPDDTFDAVLCGWTLSYSATPGKAAAEMVRVVKPGGLIGVAVEYSTMTAADEETRAGYSIQERDRLPERVNSVDALLALFEGVVGEVFFRHDAPNKISHTAAGLRPDVSAVAVIFCVTGPSTRR
jgi:SAM-dependent methyltransferase